MPEIILKFNKRRGLQPVRKQRGVALITALFIFSLVAIAAVAMADRQSLDIRRTENLLHYDQAYMYALGGEKWAAQVLAKVDEDHKVDSLNIELDPWLNPLPPVPVEGGTISGFIRDVSGRFPLNNLVTAEGAKNDTYVKAFQRFVDYMTSGNNCGEQNSFNPELSSVLLDWIDKDEQVEVGGAEDLVYLSRERRPHRTANQLISSITELRALNNLIAEEYNCFVGSGQNPPFVNAIRATDVAINVNTAPREVIQSLHPQIDDTILSTLLEGREEDPYKKVDDFVTKLKKELGLHPPGNTPEEQKASKDFDDHMKELKLSVHSTYFEVTAIAEIGRMQVTLLSLLKRDGNKVTTIHRSLGML